MVFWGSNSRAWIPGTGMAYGVCRTDCGAFECTVGLYARCTVGLWGWVQMHTAKYCILCAVDCSPLSLTGEFPLNTNTIWVRLSAGGRCVVRRYAGMQPPLHTPTSHLPHLLPHPFSALCSLHYALCSLLAAICSALSAICYAYLLSALYYLLYRRWCCADVETLMSR
jgi:hypothetical protein